MKWCINTMQFHPNYRDLILNRDGQVDFSILLPPPESLTDGTQEQCDCDIYVYLTEKRTIGRKDAEQNEWFRLIGSMGGNTLPRFMSDSQRKAADYAERETGTYDEAELEQAYQRGKLVCDNFSLYGAKNLTAWYAQNWGSLSNAADTCVDQVTSSHITVHFTSIYSPPRKWMIRLSQHGVSCVLNCKTREDHWKIISYGDGTIQEP